MKQASRSQGRVLGGKRGWINAIVTLELTDVWT